MRTDAKTELEKSLLDALAGLVDAADEGIAPESRSEQLDTAFEDAMNLLFPEKALYEWTCKKDINNVILCAFLDIAHVLHALEIDDDPGSINRKALKDTLSDLQKAHPEIIEHPYFEAQMREED